MINVTEKYEAKYSDEYYCPTCKLDVNDLENTDYYRGGVLYPICVNVRTMDVDCDSQQWDEIHFCACGQKYYFKSND